jgi:ABC-2 type transport system ATP-binding protein
MVLEASKVSVTFSAGLLGRNKIRALDDFSVTIEQGDIFGLLGPNGSGKSTAMYCFLGLIRPQKGSVSLLGCQPEQGSPVFDRVGYVPEEPHYHQYLTVEEMSVYYCALYSHQVTHLEIDEAIERAGLSEFRKLRVDKCSKGMKQKLGLLLCTLGHPEIVFLDEPTRGLDPLAVKQFRDIILEMNRQGTTFVINSHVLSEVELICSRVAIMNRGRVVRQDDLSRIIQTDMEHYTVEFEAVENPPPFLLSPEVRQGRTQGRIASVDLQEFLQWSSSQNLKLYECSLTRMNLEEAFFKTLEGASGD